MESLLPFGIDPAWIGTIIAGLLAGIFYWKLRSVVNISRNYARMTVAKSRIQADGVITLSEPDIPEFVSATFEFMDELEAALSWVSGYIINHPSTGWIKAYAPGIAAVTKSTVKELAATAPPATYKIETVTPDEPQTETVGQPG